MARAGKRCEWPGCGKTMGRLFADHKHEVKDGGSPFDPANGWVLCFSHHVSKTNAARAERMRRR
jgi:5-methylcytosine-specific restriction enzyme A